MTNDDLRCPNDIEQTVARTARRVLERYIMRIYDEAALREEIAAEVADKKIPYKVSLSSVRSLSRLS